LQIIFSRLKPYRGLISLTVVFLFIAVICDLFLPNLMSSIVKDGIETGNNSVIITIGLQMLAISLGAMLASVGSNFVSSKIAMSFGRDLRSASFRKISHFSLHEVDKIGTSSLITRNTNDIVQLQMLMNFGLRMMVDVPLHMIGGIVLAVSKDRLLSLIVVFALPLLATVVLINVRWTTPLFTKMMEKIDNLNRVLRENLSGMRVIRAFNRINHEKKRFNDSNKDLTDNSLKAMRRMAIMQPATMLIMNAATISIYFFGALRIESGGMQYGDIMAFTQYVMQILMSLMMATMMINMIPRAMVSARRVGEVLTLEAEVKDPVSPSGPADGVRGTVRFEDVTFRYPGAENPVITGISFEANPGETIAIIGSTGSGKSTLINLIPRFYDIESGNIYVDNVNIRDYAQADLRSRIGLIPQKALLFTGTIADNIRYGKSDATDEEIVEAAEIAQAMEFINMMPDGFEHLLSQEATNVSGGQKQRISIARALVRKPEIYIFDDSFSALDFKTDSALRTAMKPFTLESTVIIVAQRVSTVMTADRILVLDDGNCVGLGSHSELMESCDVYREIVSSQLSEEELA